MKALNQKLISALIMSCHLTCVSTVAFATFFPRKALDIYPQPHSLTGIDRNTFNLLLDKLAMSYDDIVYRQGGNLIVSRLWHSSRLFASASQRGSDWIISLFGGLARHPTITDDGLTVIACHELGHHLAGFPWMSDWASNEGNADYFAIHACTRRLWRNEHQQNAKFAKEIPAFPKTLCDEKYKKSPVKRQHLCYREMMAGFSAAQFIASLEQGKIYWNQHDSTKVPQTKHDHPPPQCRFDTFMRAALCERPFNDEMIPWNEGDLSETSCFLRAHTRETLSTGTRPRCWFKPRK